MYLIVFGSFKQKGKKGFFVGGRGLWCHRLGQIVGVHLVSVKMQNDVTFQF